MKIFYHSCKFCTLTMNFSEVRPRLILLQTTVFAVRLTNMLNTSQRLVNKNSLTWWFVFKTSWRCLQDVFARRLEDVLKTFWRRLEHVLNTSWRRLENVLKTSSEDVWVIRIYSSSSRSLEDVFIKTNVCWVYLTPTAKNKSSVRPGYITLMCWMCSKLTMKTLERDQLMLFWFHYD